MEGIVKSLAIGSPPDVKEDGEADDLESEETADEFSDDDLSGESEDDAVATINKIRREHLAKQQALARRGRIAGPRSRTQNMSQKRKMNAVKTFQNFTKKLKQDTGITIRSLKGGDVLDLEDLFYSESEGYSDTSDGLSEPEFEVNPSAALELNQGDESYIDPFTGDFVVPVKKPQVENVTENEDIKKTFTINDIIKDSDEDLPKSMEINCSEVSNAETILKEGIDNSNMVSENKVLDNDTSSKSMEVEKDQTTDVKQPSLENTAEKEGEKKLAALNSINVRRNIRDVMDEKQLDASTLAAQRQESERLARVQEQQRIIREVQRQIAINKQNKLQARNLALLQGSGASLLKKPGQKINLSNTVLVKLPSGEVKRTSLKPNHADVMKLKSIAAAQKQLVKSDEKASDRKEVVEIVDSSSDGSTETESSSDSDDCIMLSDSEVAPSPEPEEDPNNSGLHVNDAYNIPDDQGRVIINIGHPEKEEDIFLAPQIARIIKPHQIGGVRFLYDNIIESVERFATSTGFGCILAHSMGLGKTLQIVSFTDIFLRHTPAKTVLCIMPINTLQNWVAEFNMWLPMDATNSPLTIYGEVRPREFPIYVLNDSHKTLQMRAKVVKDWSTTGGVLMIGYELYRLLSMKKDKKPRRKKKPDPPKLEQAKPKETKDGNDDTQGSSDNTTTSKPEDAKQQDMKRMENGEKVADVVSTEPPKVEDTKKDDDPSDEDKKLLDEMYAALVKPGPDLVICDEGHRIKNSHSNISYALKQMRTKRRVVLTGYPLQNNLLEYWCMVDFVRPNYLGTKTEFCNMFERPIQNGQCIDSTPQDIRLMRYRAHVLHSLLVGFVQRRSHAVLQSTLPQKEEYVLLIRMTPLQRKLYDTFMNDVVRSKTVPNPLKAFAICCKIWNHPDVLYMFLKKRAETNLAVEMDLDLEEVVGSRLQKSMRKPTRAREKKSNVKKPAATIPPNTSNANSRLTVQQPQQNQSFDPQSYPYPNQQNYQGQQPWNYPPPNQGYQGYDQNYQTQPYQYNSQQGPENYAPGYDQQNYWNQQGYYGNSNYYNQPGFQGGETQYPQASTGEPNQQYPYIKQENQNYGQSTYPPNAQDSNVPPQPFYNQNQSYPPNAESGFPNPPSTNYPQNTPPAIPNPNQYQNPQNISDSTNQSYPPHPLPSTPSPAQYPPQNYPPSLPNPASNPNQYQNPSQNYQQTNPPTNQFQSPQPNYEPSITQQHPYQNPPPQNYPNQNYPQASTGPTPQNYATHTSHSVAPTQPTTPHNFSEATPSVTQTYGQNPLPSPHVYNSNPPPQNYTPNPTVTPQSYDPNQPADQNPPVISHNNPPTESIPYTTNANKSFPQNHPVIDPQPNPYNSSVTNPSSFPQDSQPTNYPPTSTTQPNSFNSDPNYPNRPGPPQSFAYQQPPTVPFQQDSNRQNYNQQFGSEYQGNQYPPYQGQQYQNYPPNNQNYYNQAFDDGKQQIHFNEMNSVSVKTEPVDVKPNVGVIENQNTQNENIGTNGYPTPIPSYLNSPIETKSPSGSADIPISIVNAMKTESNIVKDEKPEVKSESDNEVKIEDLDTKTIVNSEIKKDIDFKPIDKKETKGECESDVEKPKKNSKKETPKNKPAKSRPKAGPKSKTKAAKASKSKDKGGSESEESEKEEKKDKEEEAALAKKTEEMTYDWAAELLKNYIPGLIENSAKMELFFMILNESIVMGDRMLLFSQSLFTLNLIEDFLERNFIPGTNNCWQRNTSYFRLDGSTHALEREKLINEFNSNTKVHLFLVSTRAGSLGINLVGANRVIVFDASWNPCHDTQAVCRVYRYGQQKPCFVYRFVMDCCLEKKIYDRQINKQGMADRIVDECNPDAVLSMKEITNLCWDADDKEPESKDLSESREKYSDVIMQSIVTNHWKMLSREPFKHESLLVDRKEKKLSSAEKRLAQRGYELEKKAAAAPKPLVGRARPVGTVRPMQHAARWIPAEVWRRQGMTAQEMTLPLDVVIPTNSAEKANIVLKAGQRVMVLKSPKGIYMQLESGKIIAIKTSFKVGQKPGEKDSNSPVGKKVIGVRPSSAAIPGSLKNNSAITVTPKNIIRPGLQRVMPRPGMQGRINVRPVFNKGPKPMFPGQNKGQTLLRGKFPMGPRQIRPNLIVRNKENDKDSKSRVETHVLDSEEEVETRETQLEVGEVRETSNDTNSTDASNVAINCEDNALKHIEVSEPVSLLTDEMLPSEATFESEKPKTTTPNLDPSTPKDQPSPKEESQPKRSSLLTSLKSYRHHKANVAKAMSGNEISRLEKTVTAGSSEFRQGLDDITSQEPERPGPKSRKKRPLATQTASVQPLPQVVPHYQHGPIDTNYPPGFGKPPSQEISQGNQEIPQSNHGMPMRPPGMGPYPHMAPPYGASTGKPTFNPGLPLPSGNNPIPNVNQGVPPSLNPNSPYGGYSQMRAPYPPFYLNNQGYPPSPYTSNQPTKYPPDPQYPPPPDNPNPQW